LREEERTTIQSQRLRSRLLLILALAAALLAGLVAVQWATCHRNLTRAFVSTLGGASGGGHIRRWQFAEVTAEAPTTEMVELLVSQALSLTMVAAETSVTV
jgi:hypothetical protein